MHFFQQRNDKLKQVLQKGLEGLVLKNVTGVYEPGKRHWLKIKKDYLFDGKMADSADLVVLGAWFGTGKKGGMLSIFLMGCFDDSRNVWKTVTKVHTGLDDAALEKLQVNICILLYCFYVLPIFFSGVISVRYFFVLHFHAPFTCSFHY